MIFQLQAGGVGRWAAYDECGVVRFGRAGRLGRQESREDASRLLSVSNYSLVYDYPSCLIVPRGETPDVLLSTGVLIIAQTLSPRR